ncbi:SDR family oxidoreductase [Polynucleobacter sp. MWH-Aus1W21]|uniref:SDR family oxidoreductase n=1 Tax=Polynucleobacter sp. MWH-Aus1W21 TaxID=1855880 RepID=UPI001BFCE055|nr:SDR family oxidoreductase [Polynucleobacter sp. MWH-Aus1W21]QWD66580.1 SDR family oxidoreductase [Polynucleobacter sp. MWH-Aus1W21]
MQIPLIALSSHSDRNSAPLVIVGSTGLLGQALRSEACKRGYQVYGLARSGADVNLDIQDTQKLLEALGHVRPKYIINAAALINLDECERNPAHAHEINALAVKNIANYCQKHDVKLVQISTDHYFSGDGEVLHDEQAEVQLLNTYAKSKYEGELFAQSAPNSLILRTNIVGFRGWIGRPTFVEWAIAALSEGSPVTLFDDFFTSSIHVKAFAGSLFDLIDKNASGIFNLAAREVVSKADFLLKLAHQLELPVAGCTFGSVHSVGGVLRADSLGLDVLKAETILGYPLPKMDEVIAELAREYRERLNAIR